MGNRTGSPPSQYDDEGEEADNQPDTDETTQTGITDPTQTKPEDEKEPSEDEPDDTEDPAESQEGGSGGGAPVDMPTGTNPGEQPTEKGGEEEIEDEPESEEERESNEQDDAEEDEFQFVYGDIVRDREEKPDEEQEPEDLVVVNLPDESISEWQCNGGVNLAERNPGYPPTDDVVVVVKVEILEEELPDWDEREEEYQIETLDDEDVDYDCYPSLRLKLEEPSHLRTQ